MSKTTDKPDVVFKRRNKVVISDIYSKNAEGHQYKRKCRGYGDCTDSCNGRHRPPAKAKLPLPADIKEIKDSIPSYNKKRC
ncbi:MAG: hypothetical protein ACI4CS_04840 [Candidatus Weimeria sp.]